MTMEDRILIHTTSITGRYCDRKLELSIANVLATNPKRWVTQRGTLMHEVLKKWAKTGKFMNTLDYNILCEPYFEDFGEMIAADLGTYFNKAVQIVTLLEEDPIAGASDKEGWLVEEKLELDWGETALGIQGTPDIVLPMEGIVIDFKSGKSHQKTHDDQLSIYRYLLKAVHDIDITEGWLVYAGNDEIKVVMVKLDKDCTTKKETRFKVADEIEVMIREYLELYEGLRTTSTYPKDPITHARESYMCIFCPWMGGHCKGV